ncbi:NAD-dependent epimerase/dehydratase family protein [Hirschia baltica]|uniref:dTDP-glucose 4,6-dehydratase n=1 Tax=Hirschia baltica (strain ATCC 49814 / DSM 5838 / IFAM 1418) TaxID=582402 RepID=C6XNC4_HIRBI|nr:NAD-dependent epimerase/dehydratase family protein [Hirschia baltica]ACT60068.1 dTDP-glucose 4,6-dehydratase [Hirschia baltica ATCC 49814]
MRLFVSGGCGFVGSSLVKQAVINGSHVFNMDMRNTAQIAPQLAEVKGKKNYSQLIGNVTDSVMLSALLKEFKPDAFIHCAGGLSEKHGTPSLQGAEATIGVLEAVKTYYKSLDETAQKKFKLVIPFNTLIYGSLNGSVAEFDTNTPLSTTSITAARAVMDLVLVNGWSAETKIPVIYAGASAIYGPNQNSDALIPSVLKAAVKQTSISPDRAYDTLDWLHVDDFADGLLAAAKSGKNGHTYLFSGRSERRHIDITTNVLMILDGVYPRNDHQSYKVLLHDAPQSQTAPLRCALSPIKAETDLNWYAKNNLLMGLRETVIWNMQKLAPKFTVQTNKAANSNFSASGLAAE